MSDGFHVLLDFGVIFLVVVLLAFELMVVLLSVSLTAPFERLQHLVSEQSAGDFSKRIGLAGRNVLDRLAAVLSERSDGFTGLLPPPGPSSPRAQLETNTDHRLKRLRRVFSFVAGSLAPCASAI